MSDLERLLELEKQRLEVKYPKLYWAKYYHTSTRGGSMSFDTFPFLVDVYKTLQTARSVTVMKAVQLGFSEMFIVSHLEEANRGLSVQYVLPKGDIRNRFVQNRINRLVRRVPFYKSRMADAASTNIDNVVLKKFGLGVINYVDSNSASNFTEFPGDALYVDEVDRCNQMNIALAPDRLSASPFKYERYVGNPTVTNFGVEIMYRKGSQGEWFNKCPHCNFWQGLEWIGNIVKQTDKRTFEQLSKGETVEVLCIKCGKPIDRFGQAQWVHRYNGNEEKTFHVSKIASPFTTMDKLLVKFQESLLSDDKLQIFFNSDLGLPYTIEGSRINKTMLDATRLQDYFPPDKYTESGAYAGVDVGTMIHVVIRRLSDKGKRLALFIGEVKTEAQVLELFKRYNVNYAVMDALPEQRLVERLQERHKHLYACFFGRVKLAILNKSDRTMTFKRTVLLDKFMEQMRGEEIVNAANVQDIKDYYKHLQSNTRILNEDGSEYIWQQSVDPDHYHLAEAYAVAAGELAVGSDIFAFYEAISDGKLDGTKAQLTTAETGKSKDQILNDMYGKWGARR